jgi:general secretion pathway protein N
MSRLFQAAALVGLLLVCLVVSAPARLLNLLLPPQQLVMQGFSGSVWQGSAGRALVRVGSGYLHLGAVQWRLSPLSLLLFSPRLNLSSQWGKQTLQGDVTLRGRQDVDLSDFDIRVAAALVQQFAPVSLGGTLSAQLAELKLRDGRPFAGSGRLLWQDGAWQSPQGTLQLGSYALDFQQLPGEALIGDVLTLSGPVQAVGTLSLLDTNYALNITVTGQGDTMEPQLKQALSLIARPVAGGYQLELEGEL